MGLDLGFVLGMIRPAIFASDATPESARQAARKVYETLTAEELARLAPLVNAFGSEFNDLVRDPGVTP
jgi:hypothetical protein